MWPFNERRHRKRYMVNWDATVCCSFPNVEEKLQAEVVEISMEGARILLPQMQVGPYHLLVDNQSDQLELKIPLPEGPVRSQIIVKWYNLLDDDRLFTVGIEFLNMPDDSKSLLKEKFKNLKYS